jgi:hypothetical protein
MHVTGARSRGAAKVEPYQQGIGGLNYVLKSLGSDAEDIGFSQNLSAFVPHGDTRFFGLNAEERRHIRRIQAQAQANRKSARQPEISELVWAIKRALISSIRGQKSNKNGETVFLSFHELASSKTQIGGSEINSKSNPLGRRFLHADSESELASSRHPGSERERISIAMRLRWMWHLADYSCGWVAEDGRVVVVVLFGDRGVVEFPGVVGVVVSVPGAVGVVGSVGIDGLVGELGEVGFIGWLGLVGMPGLVGILGLVGEPGVLGVPGVVGVMGKVGLAGDVGLVGVVCGMFCALATNAKAITMAGSW